MYEKNVSFPGFFGIKNWYLRLQENIESGESLVCLLESMQQEVGKIEMIDKENDDGINEEEKVLIRSLAERLLALC